MGFLSKIDIAECKALHRQGTVKVIDTVHRVMDVEIEGVLHEDVPVHYHCMDEWKTHTHPHTESEQTQMLAAFKVDDQVLVLCDDEGKPLYVTGFLENPKSCAPTIVLFKQTGEEYDWWFWDLNEDVGYHQNPEVPFPTIPEIISKTWACVDSEEVEYYSRLTPALQVLDTQECVDDCGLIHFDGEECCDEYIAGDNEDDAWGLCPCGGTWSPEPAECTEIISCGEFSETRHLVGAPSTQARTNRQIVNCPLGMSWGLTLGSLSERVDVGPRNRTSGSESKSISTVITSACGPYIRNRRCCGVYDPEKVETTCNGDPYTCGDECNNSQVCTDWVPGPPGAVWRWTIYTAGGAGIPSGCMEYEHKTKNSGYSTEDVPLTTRVAIGAKETIFEGGWSQYISESGTVSYFRKRDGYDNACQSCNQEMLEEDDYSEIAYSFSEQSYGVAGWHTVGASDGRIAVLVPLLSLAASATSVDGNTTGSISSSTEALLRIVEDSEEEFGFGEEESNYDLAGMPSSRDDLGIKPNCYPRDIPLDIDLRAFHWHETYDWILVAYVIGELYKAGLAKKQDNTWQLDELTAFKVWVATNNLEDYTAFLN